MTKTICDLGKVADELGCLKAKIAGLRAIEAEMVESLKEGCEGSVEGKLFRAVVSWYTTTVVDYSGLVKHLKPTPAIIRRFTTTEERTALRVIARNGRE
jgi:hypothetical protein